MNQIDFEPEELNQYYEQSLLVFFFQMTLCVMFIRSMGGNSIEKPDFAMNLVRFMCGFICHLFILPEVKLGMDMIESIMYKDKH